MRTSNTTVDTATKLKYKGLNNQYGADAKMISLVTKAAKDSLKYNSLPLINMGSFF